MDTPTKVRENRLRRMAQRQGLRLVKLRPSDHALPSEDEYMLTDCIGDGQGMAVTLDQAEAFLTRTTPRLPGAVWSELVEFKRSRQDEDHRRYLLARARELIVEAGGVDSGDGTFSMPPQA